MGVVLHVDDIETASRFYQTLGFVQTVAFANADGALAVAFLTYGPCSLLLGRRDELHYENAARKRKVWRGIVITLLVPELELIYRTVRAEGLEILLEPVDEFYGDRVFMFLDANGYEWKISQTVAQVSEGEVASIVAAS